MLQRKRNLVPALLFFILVTFSQEEAAFHQRVFAQLTISDQMPSRSDRSGVSPGFVVNHGVEILDVEFRGPFENSLAPEAFRYACSPDTNTLRTFFLQHRSPFSNRAIRQIGGASCHLWYQPTIPGFRADPDNWPVSELYFDVETLSFLSGRAKGFGDCLDVAKSIAEEVDRPLKITLGVSNVYETELYEQARQHHFPSTIHQVELRNNQSLSNRNPWVQDYFKAGIVHGRRRILVTRQLYEGFAENGEKYRSLLDSFQEQQFVRSKLSWEGGDLQFTLHPKKPDKLVLFYGDAARKYWGYALSDAEYEYVLKLEFGADYVVNLGGVTAHIDYLVWFLPEDRIALVAEPLKFDSRIVQGAAQELERAYGSIQCPQLASFHQLSGTQPDKWRAYCSEVKNWIDRLETFQPASLSSESEALQIRFASYIPSSCQGRVFDCFTVEAQERVLRQDLEMFRDWISKLTLAGMYQTLPLCLASVIESQFRERRDDLTKRIQGKIKKLRKLGFRIIRIPSIEADPDIPWSGISYANGLLLDRKLFVPRFGLGEAEDALFAGIQEQLPSHYRVIPVLARHTILTSGGIHCTTGIVRNRN